MEWPCKLSSVMAMLSELTQPLWPGGADLQPRCSFTVRGDRLEGGGSEGEGDGDSNF